MHTVDFVIIGVVAAVLIASVCFIFKSKKSGKKCIGCPDNCACSGSTCNGGCAGQCGHREG